MRDYRTVRIDDLQNTPNPTREKKEVDEAVGATEFGFNVYRAEPGEPFPWGYHRHPDHEELFYVLDGEVEVGTEEGTVHLGPGEALFVPPDRRTLARAAGDDTAELIAVGAPKATDGAVIEEECPDCGAVGDREYDVREAEGATWYVLTCEACGAETDRFRD